MNKFEDLHIHSIVSDGEMHPIDIIKYASKIGLKKISITDHDSIGAYHNFETDLFDLAEQNGIVLSSGIELDCLYEGKELHLLGYNFDLNNKQLRNYLKTIKLLRKKRITELIDCINKRFNKKILIKKEIIKPYIDVFMKPHIVRPLIKKGIFNQYKEASLWISNNIKISSKINKPHVSDMIKMIRNAGGIAVLAHPAFLILENKIKFNKIMEDLVKYGMDGIEYYYPYQCNHNTGFNSDDLSTFNKKLKLFCTNNDLTMTKGNDAHTLQEFQEANQFIQNKR